MQGKHYKVKSIPYNGSYIDAFHPRFENGYVFWFDDSGRERAAKADNLKNGADGSLKFSNADRGEEIIFKPVRYDILPPFWNGTHELEKVCAPIHDGKAYFRPFLCRGNILEAKTFLVGINPATPIFPEDVGLRTYVEMLLSHEKFYSFYVSLRKKRGKRGISHTREGIGSFGRWLEEKTGCPVLETNMIAYPTRNEDSLKLEPEYIWETGKQIFRSLLFGIRPKLIVLHGDIVGHFLNILRQDGITPEILTTAKRITEMEKFMPVLSFTYPDGVRADVAACRHLSRYKMYKAEHESFKQRLGLFLKVQDSAKILRNRGE